MSPQESEGYSVTACVKIKIVSRAVQLAGGLKTQRYHHIKGRNRAKEAPVVRLFPGYNSAGPVYNMLRATESM